MRVISGSIGGRVFNAPDSARIHPMSEKVRGAIFSSLGDISGLKVLDAYSGSGALVIEAISRGAEEGTAVEADQKAAKTIEASLKQLSIETQVKVVKSTVEAWLKRQNAHFDLILADPPYNELTRPEILNSLAKCINSSGLMVLSWPGRTELPQIDHLRLIKQKSFNDAQVGYYRATN